MHPDVPDLSGSPTAVISWLLSAPKWEVREKGIQGRVLYVIKNIISMTLYYFCFKKSSLV